MKCAEFTEIVHDLARSRYLDRVQVAIARAHAENCPACGCLLVEAERLAAVLRDASVNCRRLEAPERVESGLLAAFRAAHTPTRQRHPRSKLAWLLAFGYAGAAAALSLLIFVWLARSPARHPSRAVARVAAGPATLTVARAETMARQMAANPGNSVVPSNANSASGFVPVPFSGGIVRGDSDVIVRVQVPRSALAELGYPIDETDSEAMVQADLIVGEDGWPHAVRIVR